MTSFWLLRIKAKKLKSPLEDYLNSVLINKNVWTHDIMMEALDWLHSKGHGDILSCYYYVFDKDKYDKYTKIEVKLNI